MYGQPKGMGYSGWQMYLCTCKSRVSKALTRGCGMVLSCTVDVSYMYQYIHVHVYMRGSMLASVCWYMATEFNENEGNHIC